MCADNTVEPKKHQDTHQAQHQCKHIKTSSAGASRKASSSSPGYKCKIIISTIILLLCHTSHVLAIRKGRLMSPSSFTALSGDLHVQIQFSGDEDDSGVHNETHAVTANTKPARSMVHDGAAGGSVENTITSTLVISKYIDDFMVDEPHPTLANNSMPLLQRKRKEIVQNIQLFPDPRNNVTQIAVPCQTFTRGGLYEMQVVTNLRTTATLGSSNAANATPAPTLTTTTLIPVNDERLRQTLDVRWPSAEMLVSPVRLRTYPERAVEVTLRFPAVDCERAWHSEDLPEFWLELVYCGRERTCAQLPLHNISKSNVLYAEQVRGFPRQKLVKLSCELFGLAGNYAVQLRPMVPAPDVPITRRFLSVDWSDKFVFNVYARSIFPCDPHTGIGVLYEYPACILEQGDRVRVFAKLRADVASLKPPTSLHYVSEQRVVKSQHSLYFSCDLFTEKYVEYCFVYVSQAISGAVADVRMDCVPTLPVSESDTGGWGPWSEWTPCSTNCLGGTRNRYRFCDSPPPRYGAKFCEGTSVETQKCGKPVSDTWDCIYETSGANLNKINRTEVSQEIGPGCRCGCIVHLGSSKPKRMLAGATQSCPGRSFWLIQVDGEQNIALSLDFLRLPCPAQYLKVRDGPSLSSTLLIELNGGVGASLGGSGAGSNLNMPTQIESTGAQLLLEFFAGDTEEGAETAGTGEMVKPTGATTDKVSTTGADINSACTGGFLASVEQIGTHNASAPTAVLAATRLSVKSRAAAPKSKWRTKFTLVHLSAVVFASIIILISAMLGAQYIVRYRKYHLAVARRRDEGSRLHTPCASLTSLQSPPSRAMSTTTLISEVIYLVKMRPKHQLRHSILRESVDAENLARETQFNDGDTEARMTKCMEELGSNGSIVTLRNEIASPNTESLSRSPSTEDLAAPKNSGSASGSTGSAEQVGSCGGDTLTRKDSAKDSESIISSGMSSIYNSPPMSSKRLSKYSERYDAVTLKIRNSRLEESITDCESLRSVRLSNLGSRSASISLTNGCYSPAASVVSSAIIRVTTAKESKEKQNRKKLLARPGSEFSLGNQEDLELDYYDYNVINAGAAPGSYLGMDPAHLIWIPPFDDATLTTDVDGLAREDDDKTPEPAHEPDETEPLYEEIKMPRYGHYLSARSNTESSTNNTTPSSDELSPLNSNLQSKAASPTEVNQKNSLIQRSLAAVKSPTKQLTPFLTRKQRRQAKQQSKSTLSLGGRERERKEAIPLQAWSGTKSARDIAATHTTTLETQAPAAGLQVDPMTGSYVEKETSVVKSPSDLQNFLALDDIQFADESESDADVATLRKEKSGYCEVTACADEHMRRALKCVSEGSAIRERAVSFVRD